MEGTQLRRKGEGKEKGLRKSDQILLSLFLLKRCIPSIIRYSWSSDDAGAPGRWTPLWSGRVPLTHSVGKCVQLWRHSVTWRR